MLNPDGVIIGNYRCSLAARDLNRNYRHPRRENFPTVWHTKTMLENIQRGAKVMIYCDLHGHSRKQNVFMYGCNLNEKKLGLTSPLTLPEQLLKERLFPWLMALKVGTFYTLHHVFGYFILFAVCVFYFYSLFLGSR